MNDSGRGRPGPRRARRADSTTWSVIHDEIDLPFGRIESRLGGGLAGHNGLKSLKQGLGGPDFRRIRVGVGRPDSPTPRSSPPGCSAGSASRRPRCARSWSARPTRSSAWSSEPRAPTAPQNQSTSRAAPPGGRSCMLRSLLSYARKRPRSRLSAEAARREPQRAFVSASLRPYLLASLIDLDPERPALVVAGDDRAARDLAADLRAFLAPRPVRFYPARGVRYESHLAPPPHLVGLRVAALDALARRGAGGRSSTSAVALAEKVPDPELRPHGFEIEKGGLLDLEETADQLVACGYERVDQVEDRGQFALRGDILDVYPATEERAVRCELFDVEVERLTWFSTFTQRSLEEAERVEIAPAAELAPEHRELAEIAAVERRVRAPRRGRGAARGPLPRAARPGAGRRADRGGRGGGARRRRCATTGRT